jgi:hypothetical protein
MKGLIKFLNGNVTANHIVYTELCPKILLEVRDNNQISIK